LIERNLVKWSQERFCRCFCSFLEKNTSERKEAETEGEQRKARLEMSPEADPLMGI
jgi:hypothetical protein